eukprot:gene2521-12799_t
MNMQTGETASFSSPGWYFGETVFAPAPDAANEDDGVALAIALIAYVKQKTINMK